MSDLLELRDERPSPRRRRSRRSPLVKVLAVLVVLALAGGLVVGAMSLARGLDFLSSSAAEDYSGEGSGEVVVQVQPGDTATDVAATLAEKDVVASRQAFYEVAVADERSRGLQPGFYRLRLQMSAAAAFELLLDPSARVVGRVTIPEGYTVEQVLQALADGTEIPLADYQAAAADPAALGLPDYAGGKLEGFLFPATYDVEPGTDATQVLTMMVDRFKQAAADTDLEAKAAALGLSPYEAVIVASMIERESRVDDELSKVSRVVYNRLEQGIPLGIDATILYGLGRTSGGLKQSELEKDTPYNTRLNAGLVPTPIANPGQEALEAALSPEDGDWLYYVLADKQGRHLFTADYDEFLEQKAKSQREGIF